MPAPEISVPPALAELTDRLQCPRCGEPMAPVERSLRCTDGHVYDVARQGYVNLLPGDARPGTADTSAMVLARREFLQSGHYAPLVELLTRDAAAVLTAGDLIVDAGAGTGHYVSAVLDGCPGTFGLALDLSKYAARLAARAHPRLAALVVDLWQPLPVRSESAALLLDVFAPRNPAEFHRVLRPGGTLLVVTPGPRHLTELVSALGLLSVDDRKGERLQATLGGYFDTVEIQECTTRLRLSGREIEDLAGMGPSAHHVDPTALAARVAQLDQPAEVTASFQVSTFRRRAR
ncbi:MAG TPA: methyltransferase type 11 [Mycobacteriales bacterium]|jgi:23S rRNA (guanine745-N1)-methyltransferase|nr:methyltransferase type 11 [Mycobacteriales bacterium]